MDERLKGLLRAIIAKEPGVDFALEARSILEDAHISVVSPLSPFCDDEDCESCNGLGADGHHY